MTASITVRSHTRKKPVSEWYRLRDKMTAQLAAETEAAKRAAGKREPVPAASASANALRALAASIRADLAVVSIVVREGR